MALKKSNVDVYARATAQADIKGPADTPEEARFQRLALQFYELLRQQKKKRIKDFWATLTESDRDALRQMELVVHPHGQRWPLFAMLLAHRGYASLEESTSKMEFLAFLKADLGMHWDTPWCPSPKESYPPEVAALVLLCGQSFHNDLTFEEVQRWFGMGRQQEHASLVQQALGRPLSWMSHHSHHTVWHALVKWGTFPTNHWSTSECERLLFSELQKKLDFPAFPALTDELESAFHMQLQRISKTLLSPYSANLNASKNHPISPKAVLAACPGLSSNLGNLMVDIGGAKKAYEWIEEHDTAVDTDLMAYQKAVKINAHFCPEPDKCILGFVAPSHQHLLRWVALPNMLRSGKLTEPLLSNPHPVTVQSGQDRWTPLAWAMVRSTAASQKIVNALQTHPVLSDFSQGAWWKNGTEVQPIEFGLATFVPNQVKIKDFCRREHRQLNAHALAEKFLEWKANMHKNLALQIQSWETTLGRSLNWHAVDAEGNTFLHMVAERSSPYMANVWIEVLKEKKIPLFSLNHAGKSPWDIAMDRCQKSRQNYSYDVDKDEFRRLWEQAKPVLEQDYLERQVFSEETPPSSSPKRRSRL